MEPDATVLSHSTDAGALAVTSIAISLKRIADALESPGLDHGKASLGDMLYAITEKVTSCS